MRILMIGGTRFIGKHVVLSALAADHDVTVYHRGKTGSDLFPDVEHLIGDRNDDLTPLEKGDWDATVDTCAYVPRHVTSLADVLGDRGGHYAIVSSVSAYARPAGPGYDEDSALAELDDPSVETVTNETYGGLKALCERAATARFGPDTIIVRPTYVVGPDDYTWRFPWWVQRMAQGGEVLAPGPQHHPAQVIDVRDMAAWMVRMLEDGCSGAYHAVSPAPPFSWQQELETIAKTVGPHGTQLTWVDEEFLLRAGLDDGTLPLWSGGDPDVLMMAADPGRANATGLAPRPLEDTVRDTLDWLRTQEQPPSPGLDPQREAELLRRWKERESSQPPPDA
jgi:2'-hydroxyisoflavone reductase